MAKRKVEFLKDVETTKEDAYDEEELREEVMDLNSKLAHPRRVAKDVPSYTTKHAYPKIEK